MKAGDWVAGAFVGVRGPSVVAGALVLPALFGFTTKPGDGSRRFFRVHYRVSPRSQSVAIRAARARRAAAVAETAQAERGLRG